MSCGWSSYLARTQANNPRTMNSTDLFEAATIGGARALGRDDIGRLAPGCRADLVLVDVTHPMMRPAHDPVRSLIYAAGDRAVRAVYVDGQKVVENGQRADDGLSRRRRRAARGAGAGEGQRAEPGLGPSHGRADLAADVPHA